MDQYWHFAVLAYVNYYAKLQSNSILYQFNNPASYFICNLCLHNISNYFVGRTNI